MASRRGNPVAKVGNYAQETDSTKMDESMKNTLYGTGMTKTEKEYLKSRKGASSASTAIQRARKANKQPPVQE